jgi:hypothetical protein
MTQDNSWVDDLVLFSDLGTEIPKSVKHNEDVIVRLYREGELMQLTIHQSGQIRELYKDENKTHANFRALLASPSFADLAKWADSQALLLKDRVIEESIPVRALSSSRGMVDSALELFGNTLPSNGPKPRVSVTLVDGPAGIGKTSFLRHLAYQHASTFKVKRHPLFLHVESRGRMLQNLTDLMAFSLQTLRLRVTYDQIPVLVRHGLVTLAIDGFDELGDPSGYDLAWAQINELINSVRGEGQIILAGRETFVGEGRMRSALKSIDTVVDHLETVTLQPLKRKEGIDWLIENGWARADIEEEEVAALFDEGSYALRPFFLKELSRPEIAEKVKNKNIDDLLSFLVSSMIEREVSKFGPDIEAAVSDQAVSNFLQRFLEEVARDLAENQTDAVPTDTLSWIAEVVASEFIPSNIAGIFKHRANVVAFLTNDDRRGYRRFVHDQISNYFLAKSTIRSILNNELPKHVRRNIFGIEFLENFCSVMRTVSQSDVDNFISISLKQIRENGDSDRSRRNLAALVIATGCVQKVDDNLLISDISLDEVFLTETCSPIRMKNVTIAQLYAKGADFRNIKFEGNCAVISLIADEITIPPELDFTPYYITLPGRTLTDLEEKQDWILSRFYANFEIEEEIIVENILKKFPLFDLLGRLGRNRSYWLKDDEEKQTRRILDDDHWPLLRELLLKHDLLLERDNVGGKGRPGTFYHLKNKQSVIDFNNPSKAVAPLLREMLTESWKIEHQKKPRRTEH